MTINTRPYSLAFFLLLSLRFLFRFVHNYIRKLIFYQMKFFIPIIFTALTTANIVDVVKDLEDCSTSACRNAYTSIAQECVYDSADYDDCICSMPNSFFKDLYECSKSCSQWYGSVVSSSDELKSYYCDLVVNLDDPLAVTNNAEQDDISSASKTSEASSKATTSNKTTSVSGTASPKTETLTESQETPSQSQETPSESQETSSSADSGTKNFVSFIGLLAALII